MLVTVTAALVAVAAVPAKLVNDAVRLARLIPLMYDAAGMPVPVTRSPTVRAPMPLMFDKMNDPLSTSATHVLINVATDGVATPVLLGYPAVKMESHVEMQKALRRLPRLAARVAALEKGGAGAGGD